jgi:competence protein ComEA
MSVTASPPAERDVDPTSTPPWRTIEAPPSTDGPAAAAGDSAGRSGPMSGSLTAAGAILAAIACGGLAFVLAVSGGGGTVGVEGGAPFVAAGSSGVPASPGALGPTMPIGGAERVLVVEIVGAVVDPGVFRLPGGARVGDLVAAAGGYGPRVDVGRAERELNLAAPLRDGDHIRVPVRGEEENAATPGAGTGGETGPDGPLDLNTATAEQLEALPGIGPVTAAKILAARDEAPFAAIDDLRTRKLVGEKMFETIRELIAVR